MRPGRAEAAHYPSRARAWYSAVLVCVITAIAMADRLAISMLIGPIKAEFAIGDFQASLLVGAAFSLFYALFLFPIGWAADRFSRRGVLMLCLFAWTIATMACGLATGFVALFLCRALVGSGEAGLAPTTHAIIGASFPRESLAKPIAMQGIGLQLGSALGIAAAGAVLAAGEAGHMAGLPLIGDLAPWRVAFLAIAGPGLVAVMLVPTLHDPTPGRPEDASRRAALLPFIREHGALVFRVILAGAVLSIGIGVILGWSPEFLQRRFSMAPGQAGAALGSLFLAAAVLSQLLYSVAADRVARRGVPDAAFRVGLVPVSLAIPFTWFTFRAETESACLVLLFLLLCCLMPCSTIFNAGMQQLAPPALRSRLASMLVLAVSLIGFTLGPALVGWLSEYVLGEHNLGMAMLAVILSAFVVGLVMLVALLGPARRYLGSEGSAGQSSKPPS